MSHTPGPWRFDELADGIVSAGGDAVVYDSFTKHDDNLLIAAAPDLLAALRAIVEMYGPSTEYGHPAQAVWEQAEAAIAKAEGR